LCYSYQCGFNSHQPTNPPTMIGRRKKLISIKTASYQSKQNTNGMEERQKISNETVARQHSKAGFLIFTSPVTNTLYHNYIKMIVLTQMNFLLL
ncbi:hypothetical protein, partial [Escherichia coli]|uniref:hypothetical protein n=3 Tax=Escherichia coli TaxID=562 RepID=UPI001BFC730A